MSNSEYISRDAVDTKLLAMEERFIDNPFALTAIAMAINEIDKITAAGVAPVVRAHWIINSDGYYPQCSKCMEEPESGKMTKFCPNCGAKMDESEDSGND